MKTGVVRAICFLVGCWSLRCLYGGYLSYAKPPVAVADPAFAF